VAFALDTFERVVLVVLYSFFCYRFVVAGVESGNSINFLLLASEGMIVLFLLFRQRTKALSMQPQDWIVAFLGTTLALAATPADVPGLIPEGLSACLMVLGFFIQFHAKLILRRKFGVVAANRGIVATGPYQFVRHPMYLGYILTQIGFLTSTPTLWNAAVYLAVFFFQVMRILAEERLLLEDPDYQNYSKAVPYRLIPAIF
jgi:protein-S-isoprenylcysteine O-methyltransferase Ste14